MSFGSDMRGVLSRFQLLRGLYSHADSLAQFIKETMFSRGSRRKLREKLDGAIVAVVGPAPMKRNYNHEIEQSDFIMRVGNEHWPWPDTGKRTDCWVCDRGQSQSVIKGLAEIPEARWIIFKPGSRFSVRDMLNLRRKARRQGKHVLFGSKPTSSFLRKKMGVPTNFNPNLVPIALFELRQHRPSVVGIYGSDFYLGQHLYSPSSPDREKSDKDRAEFLANMFSSHDQIMQYRVCKALTTNGSWIPGGSDEFLTLTSKAEPHFLELVEQARKQG